MQTFTVVRRIVRVKPDTCRDAVGHSASQIDRETRRFEGIVVRGAPGPSQADHDEADHTGRARALHHGFRPFAKVMGIQMTVCVGQREHAGGQSVAGRCDGG
jgi:hypothetical protein